MHGFHNFFMHIWIFFSVVLFCLFIITFLCFLSCKKELSAQNYNLASKKVRKAEQNKGTTTQAYRETKKKLRTREVIFYKVTLLMVICNLLMSVIYYKTVPTQTTDMSNKKLIKTSDSFSLQELGFYQISQNEDSLPWENYLYDDLMYSLYMENDADFSVLIENYNNKFSAFIINGDKYLDKIQSDIKMLQDDNWLPQPSETKMQVDQEISEYDRPEDVPAELYKKELILLLYGNQENGDVIYQTGRCAHDIVTVLVKNDDYDIKEVIFYSSIACDYYLASIRYDNKTRSNIFVFYRLAMLFLTLEKCREFNIGNQPDQEYKKHFQLTAYALLNYCYKNQDNLFPGDTMRDLNYYMGKLPYVFAFEYKYYDLTDEAIASLHSYITEMESLQPDENTVISPHLDDARQMIKDLQEKKQENNMYKEKNLLTD